MSFKVERMKGSSMHAGRGPIKKKRLLNKKAPSFASAALVLYVACIAVLLIFRQFFGVNFFDEPVYAFFPYHLVMGGKAFIDEFFLQQNSGILLYPIYWLYVHFFGTNAIILFGRFLYLSFSFSTFLVLNPLLAPWLKQPFRALVALNIFIFAFLNLYAPSYDSLCLLFLCLSFFLLAQPQPYVFLSGLFLGLAIFVYPPMLFLLPVMLIVTRFKPLSFIAGIATPLLPFLFFILISGRLPNLVADLHLIASLPVGEAGSPLKLYKIFLILMQESIFISPFLVLTLFFYFDKKNYPQLMLAFIVLLCLIVISTPTMSFEYKSPFFLIIMTLCGALILPVEKENKRLYRFVLLPSMLAGLITAWSSNNGWLNLALGCFPGFLVSLIFCVKWIFHYNASPRNRSAGLIACCLLICIHFFLMLNAWLYVYWDGPLTTLTARIESGPFQFLYTYPQNAHFVDTWQKDLAPYAHQGYSLFEYYNTPAILLTDGFTPDTPSGIILDPGDGYPQQNSLQYFALHQTPDFIIRMAPQWIIKRVPPPVPNPPPSLLDALVKKHYHPVVIRPMYTLYQKDV